MTITDPWAMAEPEATPEPQPEPAKAVGHVSVDVKPRILDPELAHAITTTYKGGAGYDAPWVVTRASSVAEADALLDHEFKAYLDKVKRVAQTFSGGTNAAPQYAAPAARTNVPQGATEAPSWAPPKPHDDFVYKTGVSAKNGKVWHAWMPPQKGDSRDAKFFYQN